MKCLLRHIPPALTTQGAGPNDMRRRHDTDRDGFPAPFASEDRLWSGFQVDHGSQFRRIKNECPVSISLPDFDAVRWDFSNVGN
jgi:hypothetical protein